MKKGLILTVVLLLTMALLVGCNTGGSGGTDEDLSWQKIQEKGKLTIGLDDNFPPIGFRDENGNLVGSDIDMAAAACEYLGIEADFYPLEWDGVVLSLKNGDIDIIWNAFGVTPERAEEVSFSRPYMNVPQVIYVPIGSDIQEKEDLAGKIVGVQLNSTADTLIQGDDIYESLAEVRRYGSYMEAFLDMQNGRIDAVGTDVVNGQYLIELEKMTGFFEARENIVFNDEPWAVGVRKEDNALREKINEALDALKENGTSDEISRKWYGGLEIVY